MTRREELLDLAGKLGAGLLSNAGANATRPELTSEKFAEVVVRNAQAILEAVDNVPEQRS